MFGANDFSNVSPRRTSRVKRASLAEGAAAGTPGTARAAAPTLLCTRGCVFLQAIHGKVQIKMREAASKRKGMRTIHPPSGIGSRHNKDSFAVVEVARAVQYF